MEPSGIPVADFLATLSEKRRGEALTLIDIMSSISGQAPAMWGPSIIGFGTSTYTLESGRSGQMGVVGFSPRKASLTIYVPEGFDRYGDLLDRLGPHKTSVSCLYITSLARVDIDVLTDIIRHTHDHHASPQAKLRSVEEYIDQIPDVALPRFRELRSLLHELLPGYEEVLSYGVIGLKKGRTKRAPIFMSAWADHLAIYPAPRRGEMAEIIAPYLRGKGTLWFDLDKDLPRDVIAQVVEHLVSDR